MPGSSSVVTAPAPWRPKVKIAILAIAGAAVSLIGAVLVAFGYWYVAAVLILAYPLFVALHRRPLVVLPIWLALGPLITVTDSSAVRMVFWVVHRGLPLAALIAVLVARMVGSRSIPFPRLGLAEAMMAGYVVVTLLSIVYTSPEPLVAGYLLYDRVVAPMMLYLVIRLGEPEERDLRGLIPVLGFVLLFETTVGVLSWVSPGLLPGEWLNKLGARTTGSLSEVNLYGTTVLLGGLFMVYGAMSSRKARELGLALALLALSLIMVFMTFSRASWLAAALVMAVFLVFRPRHLVKFFVVSGLLVALLVGSGLVNDQLEFADRRLVSEESTNSALTRLPVAVASVRMFEERPLLGWGYENFDRFDYQFYGQFGNLIFPERDKASHNTYLTILAEQGLLGFILFIGPAVYWLGETVRSRRRLPTDGYLSRHLVLVAWLVILSQIVVNNFTRMQLPFGFGIWWIMLGLIASTVARFRSSATADADNLIG